MNRPMERAPLATWDCETVAQLATRPAERTAGSGPAKATAAYGGPPIVRETLALPRLRPRPAFILSIGLGTSLTCLLGVPWGEPLALVGLSFGALVVLGLNWNALRCPGFEPSGLGPYRLIAPLGAGGMGAVFLAEHRLLRRPCAVKLIRPERAGDPLALDRFEREARLTARLSHRNVVGVFDFGRTEGGTPFYVMEYLPGLSLAELLRRHGPLPAERAVHLLRQACQGLGAAHAAGLVHRDIKPDNLFVTDRGGQYDVVKLLDFGLVRPAAGMTSTRLTQDGAISGTPLFMSPEQADGRHDLDARGDIYSLGAVAYTLLTGRPPFDGRTPLEVLIAHARDAVTPPSELRGDVPADLERVILRCLAKHPQDRFQDADSLERALAACAAAGRWTPEQAARWWQVNAPTARPPKAGRRDGRGGVPELARA